MIDIRSMRLEDFLLIYFFVCLSFAWGYLIFHNQVFGVDAWYWLKMAHVTPIYFNVASILMITIITLFFYKHDRKNWKILTLFFFMNLFIIRFIEVEPDDFVMYLIFMTLTYLLGRNNKYFLIVPLSFVLFYGFSKNLFFNYRVSTHLDPSLNLNSYLIILPSIYLMLVNRKWTYFLILILLLFASLNTKFISNALPILIFYMLLNMGDHIKYQKVVLLYFIAFSSILTVGYVVKMVNDNINAFKEFCDVKTKICNNTDVNVRYFGHYFAYLGYRSNNPDEFGVFCCKGENCLKINESLIR